MRRTFMFAVLSACALMLAAGCSGTSEGGGKVAVVISTLDNPWFVILRDAAMKRVEELGYTAVGFDSENDAAKEASHFSTIITSGFDAILFNPTDADASVANVRRAVDAGIPVFCMDREINAKDAATAQILSNNFAGAVKLGEYFVKRLKGKGTYVELLGLVGDNNTWNRSKGFHSVVDDYDPDLHLVAQHSADFDRTKAAEVMSTILQKHGDIDAVFCGNDAMAMGAYQALLAAGKADQVKVFGFDGAKDVVDHIRAGKIEATGMQFPRTMAAQAAEWADKYLRLGKRDFKQRVAVPVELVTRENVQNYIPYGRKK